MSESYQSWRKKQYQHLHLIFRVILARFSFSHKFFHQDWVESDLMAPPHFALELATGKKNLLKGLNTFFNDKNMNLESNKINSMQFFFDSLNRLKNFPTWAIITHLGYRRVSTKIQCKNWFFVYWEKLCKFYLQ